ncbi:MAG: hypothetical protein VW879_10085 [Opitutae bacterium]
MWCLSTILSLNAKRSTRSDIKAGSIAQSYDSAEILKLRREVDQLKGQLRIKDAHIISLKDRIAKMMDPYDREGVDD